MYIKSILRPFLRAKKKTDCYTYCHCVHQAISLPNKSILMTLLVLNLISTVGYRAVGTLYRTIFYRPKINSFAVIKIGMCTCQIQRIIIWLISLTSSYLNTMTECKCHTTEREKKTTGYSLVINCNKKKMSLQNQF